ncbi:hypothetical protein VKT23_009369 [Stygiomarasmius scandens]|uniref:G domain-containing protein n=1 Tax=Marasmiellus scandens TaxID=2682957 RepID=A0ABR1JJE7_9AGAR
MIPIGPGIGIGLRFSRAQGAALMLPEAAVRRDYRGLPDIRKYVEANAEVWYQHLIEQVRMDAYNGCIYVITGYDKTHCYENLVFRHYSNETSVSVRFSSPLLPTGDFGRLALSYDSATTHTPLTGGSNPQHTHQNLSVFVRGFKVMLRRNRWPRPKSTIKLVDMKEADPKDVTYKGALSLGPNLTPANSQTLPSTSAIMGQNRGRQSTSSLVLQVLSDSPWDPSDFEVAPDSESDSSLSQRGSSILDSESEPEDTVSRVYHPSDAINKRILEKYPDVTVAITHDEDWFSALQEMDDQVDDTSTLTSARSAFTTHTSSTRSSSRTFVSDSSSSVFSDSFNFPLDNRLSTLLATLDYDSTEEAFQDQGYKHGFRILVMGRRNAGKTTLLKRMTDSFDGEVEIRDPNGNLRGNSAIDNEIRYPSNRAYVFHDSRGAEAGSLEEPQLVREFIKKRQSMKLDDRIHVIWYCLPVDSDRPLLEDELSFFNFEELEGVPIVAIFTKFEGRINKAFSALKEEGLPLRQAKLGAKSKAVADFRHVIADRKLGSFRHPPGAHVFLQGKAICDKDPIEYH